MGMPETKKITWGRKWILGGYFNEIICQEDKYGGKRRPDSSFVPFRTFIREMEMEDVTFRGRRWTWANNRQKEGFIDERLDFFFGSTDWLIDCDHAEMREILTQASDHSILLLDSKPQQVKVKSRFIFDSR